MRLNLTRLVCSFIFILQGCGSEQPSGNLESCLGTLSYFEEGGSVLQQRTITNLAQVGQYLNVSQGIVASAMMVKGQVAAGTTIEVAIYRFSLSDFIYNNSPPLAKMTVTEITSESNGVNWLKLPTPYEFKARTDADIARGELYFVSLLAVTGSMTVDVRQHRTSNGLLAGFRMGSPISWGNVSDNTSIAMGLRGDANCESTHQQ